MSPLRTAIAPRTKRNARRITRPPFLYPCGFVCGATLLGLAGFRCHRGQKPLCHHSCRNSPCAKGHPARPARHWHPSRALLRFAVENNGANRLQAVAEKCPRPPLAQFVPKLGARARWRVAPPRDPAEHAPLTAPKRAPLAPPVRHRLRREAVALIVSCSYANWLEVDGARGCAGLGSEWRRWSSTFHLDALPQRCRHRQ